MLVFLVSAINRLNACLGFRCFKG